ncbi:hypothetical protein TTRE_0000406801 [Trichuris trichiura]|uniref:Uncharacterized protein n=1 Tax=Trichuris trichiura TaxID=36087 RepID=A0A077ZAU8_TRITR|nr:hypothetical protein TTRE_0000406801 [Trichuris trichiura]
MKIGLTPTERYRQVFTNTVGTFAGYEDVLHLKIEMLPVFTSRPIPFSQKPQVTKAHRMGLAHSMRDENRSESSSSCKLCCDNQSLATQDQHQSSRFEELNGETLLSVIDLQIGILSNKNPLRTTEVSCEHHLPETAI